MFSRPITKLPPIAYESFYYHVGRDQDIVNAIYRDSKLYGMLLDIGVKANDLNHPSARKVVQTVLMFLMAQDEIHDYQTEPTTIVNIYDMRHIHEKIRQLHTLIPSTLRVIN